MFCRHIRAMYVWHVQGWKAVHFGVQQISRTELICYSCKKKREAIPISRYLESDNRKPNRLEKIPKSDTTQIDYKPSRVAAVNVQLQIDLWSLTVVDLHRLAVQIDESDNSLRCQKHVTFFIFVSHNFIRNKRLRIRLTSWLTEGIPVLVIARQTIGRWWIKWCGCMGSPWVAPAREGVWAPVDFLSEDAVMYDW